MAKLLTTLLLSLLLTIVFSSSSLADKADSDDIILGVSNVLSGPAAQLGTRLNQGARVYFDKVNAQGGINGQHVHLHILDDGYEPFKAVTNIKELLAEPEVLALFNFVGTPTTQAILPMITRSQLPFLMPFTGAEFLRTKELPRIFNLRASYFQEADAQIEYIVKQKKFKKIGLLIQADAFGLAVEQGYINKMNEVGLSPVVVTRYRRNTNDIALALEVLKERDVEAVLFVGTYKPMAFLINTAAKQGFNPFYSTVSFVSSHELFARIDSELPVKVLVTEVVPNPNDCTEQLCQQFVQDMNQAGYSELEQIQFEGYLNAYVFSQSAKLCGKPLTADCLLKQLKQFPVNFFNNLPSTTINNTDLAPVYLNLFEN